MSFIPTFKPRILVGDRFPWVSQETSGNEDWWFCSRAADIYQLLLSRNDPRLIPAPAEEAKAFSVEMLYHDRPFGVHQYWTNLRPPNATALRTLLENCPEALAILPDDILARRSDWRGVLCAIKPSIQGCVVPRAAAGRLLGKRRREARSSSLKKTDRGGLGESVEGGDDVGPTMVGLPDLTFRNCCERKIEKKKRSPPEGPCVCLVHPLSLVRKLQ